jgi:hypothetical protein
MKAIAVNIGMRRSMPRSQSLSGVDGEHNSPEFSPIVRNFLQTFGILSNRDQTATNPHGPSGRGAP